MTTNSTAAPARPGYAALSRIVSRIGRPMLTLTGPKHKTADQLCAAYALHTTGLHRVDAHMIAHHVMANLAEREARK